MKKNQPFNYYLLLKWKQNENVRQIQCLVLFFSFLCLIPQTAQAQQAETAVLLKEKKASAIVENLEEEEEGTLEAEMEHQRSVWYKGMQKKNANYFKVKRQFDNYFKKYPDENSKPRQRFEDWLKTNIFYLDKKNRVVAPPAVNYNKIQKLAAIPWATVTDTMAGDWRMIGPRNIFETTYSGRGNKGGMLIS